jgi:hypothetical protein
MCLFEGGGWRGGTICRYDWKKEKNNEEVEREGNKKKNCMDRFDFETSDERGFRTFSL